MNVLTSYLYADNQPIVSNTNETEKLVTFQGRIIDKYSNEPLAGVLVKIEGTNLQAYTDFDGYFIFQNVNPGIFDLRISMVSYKENIIKNVYLTSASSSLLEIALEN